MKTIDWLSSWNLLVIFRILWSFGFIFELQTKIPQFVEIWVYIIVKNWVLMNDWTCSDLNHTTTKSSQNSLYHPGGPYQYRHLWFFLREFQKSLRATAEKALNFTLIPALRWFHSNFLLKHFLRTLFSIQ